jgi:hypothetical protein
MKKHQAHLMKLFLKAARLHPTPTELQNTHSLFFVILHVAKVLQAVLKNVDIVELS